MRESDRGAASNDHRASLNDVPTDPMDSIAASAPSGLAAKITGAIDTIKGRIGEYRQKTRDN